MRALFAFIGVLVLAAAVWIGIRHTDRLYCQLRLNRAAYDFLNHKEEAAIRQALELLDRNPNYKPALEAAIGWLVAQRQFDRARSLARDFATTRSLSPQARYHLAICAYERGDVNEAVRLCETLTSPPQALADIPMPLVNIYLAVAHGEYESARTLLEVAAPRFRDSLWYRSLLARTCYSLGDVAAASKELETAVAMGAQNPRTRLYLALCKAMAGDLPAMGRLLDELAAGGRDSYEEARLETQQWLDRSRANGRHFSLREQAADRLRVFNLRLASAAVAVRQGRRSDALSVLAAVQRDFPERIGVATRQALLYEEMGRRELAATLYRQEADRLFLAAYEAAIFDSATTAVVDETVWRRFLTTGTLALDAGKMSPTSGHAHERGWALTSAGEFSHTFLAEATGPYAFDLIARGDAAAGLWPIVEIHLDGNLVAQQYVNSPVWDLFEIHQPLTAGTHWLRIVYVNNTVTPDSAGDRNFYLDKVIIRREPD